MEAHDLLARDGEHAERIGVAQVILGGERKFRQIGERFQVVRMHTDLIEPGAVKRRMGIGVAQRPLQPFQLQRAQFIA